MLGNDEPITPITIVYQSCAAILLKIGLFDDRASVSVQEGAENMQSMTVYSSLTDCDRAARTGRLSDQHIISNFWNA